MSSLKIPRLQAAVQRQLQFNNTTSCGMAQCGRTCILVGEWGGIKGLKQREGY